MQYIISICCRVPRLSDGVSPLQVEQRRGGNRSGHCCRSRPVSASLQEEKDVKVGEATVWVENRVMPLPSPGSAMPSAGFRNSAVRKRENQVRL